MPTVFDSYVERSAKVSSTCLLAVARNRYLVPCELAGQRVSTRLYPNRVEIASDEAIVARHERLSNEGRICNDWQHHIALVQRKLGPCVTAHPLPTCPRHCCVYAKGWSHWLEAATTGVRLDPYGYCYKRCLSPLQLRCKVTGRASPW